VDVAIVLADDVGLFHVEDASACSRIVMVMPNKLFCGNEWIGIKRNVVLGFRRDL
jgi:hypothetical protein